MTRLLEATLTVLAWSILPGWWLGVVISWMDNSFDWRILPLVIPGLVAAWGAGALCQRRLDRPRSPRSKPERDPPGATRQRPNSGNGKAPNSPPVGSGAIRDSRSDRVHTWVCVRCRQTRQRSGPQRCDRCGWVTETIWPRLEFWDCIRCGRETSMADPFCDRCRRVPMGNERPWERTEHKNAQLRLW